MRLHLRRVFALLCRGGARGHFGQHAEDVYLRKFFRGRQATGFYVDVGAHDPFQLSNTAWLWLHGWRGINVDASQTVIDAFNRVRPLDHNVRAAVVDRDTALRTPTITFYSSRGIDNCATCDPVLAQTRATTQQETVPCRSLSAILDDAARLSGGQVDVLNIDIEGLDEAVVRDIDTWPVRPTVVLIEMFATDLRQLLSSPTCVQLEAAGYCLTQRMGPTAVFVRRDALPA